MSDLLSSAIAAARAQADEGADDGAATRMRIRESLAQRGAGRRKKWTLIVAVIGSLFGATAFAMHQGWTPFSSSRVAEAPVEQAAQVAAAAPRREVVEERPFVAPPGRETLAVLGEPEALAWSTDAGSPSVKAIAPAPRAAGAKGIASGSTGTNEVASAARTNDIVSRPAVTAPRASTASEPPAVNISTAVPGDSTPLTLTPTVRGGPSPTEGTSRVATTVRAADASGAGELAAYRVAHKEHFRGTDPKAALAAWDRYLAKFPDGRMALDAKYDRALVLVKLERWKEAREALAPFAATNSTYRRAEAAKILDAIRTR